MKSIVKNFVIWIVIFQSPFCFSQNSTNIIVVPDPLYSTHHFGLELAATKNSRLGLMAGYKRDSDRPTYGESNDNVTNTFSRVLIPWTYSKNGAWEKSFFITGLVGLENDRFDSVAGSSADVIFINLGLLAGYQWFWHNGLNISAMFGRAFLIENRSDKNISANESSDVIEYLNKNTKTNNHFAGGIVLGWAF